MTDSEKQHLLDIAPILEAIEAIETENISYWEVVQYFHNQKILW